MKKTTTLLAATALIIFGCNEIDPDDRGSATPKTEKTQVIVYSKIPELTPSEFYTIKVRSQEAKLDWTECFANITRNMISSLPPQYANDPTNSTPTTIQHYQRHTKDWSHSYCNIEMNVPVEFEIAKKDGSPINKAAVHPSHLAGAAVIKDGKAYITVPKPALVTVDIDGQMDDKHTSGDYTPNGGAPIHAITLFANPIIEKPTPTTPGVVFVNPGTMPPTNPNSYTILCFMPGVHDIGKNFKIYANKQYYIPGDAIVYGTFNNLDMGPGNNIKIFGYGTISGDKVTHHNYVPGAAENGGKEHKAITIDNGLNVEIKGVCIANPANHSVNINLDVQRPDKTVKVSFSRWVKVVSWRANGDGIGNCHVIEDCFLRCGDDCSYVKGDRRRCIFWKDTNAAVFHMSSISSDFPIVIEDCDILYNRARAALPGSGVFVQRGEGIPGQNKVNVLVRNIRIHDKFPTIPTFQLFSKSSNSEKIYGSSYTGIIFQNITAAATSVLGMRDRIEGCAESPWNGGVTFDNVVIGGKKLTNINDLQHNEYVSEITFR